MTSNRDLDVLIERARPPKPKHDPWRPYATVTEQERSASGAIVDVATIFLVNKECPFRCLMCDLWKYTLDEPTPLGAIPTQIQKALSQLPVANHVKLYNAGNFFDPLAIPVNDYREIARLVCHFENVIVENHPAMTNDRVLVFRDILCEEARLFGKTIVPRLEVAMGLETIHSEILRSLNKKMTVDQFDEAVRFLRSHEIDVRCFVLLKPPGLNERDGIEWALASVRHSFEVGAQCCTVIPVRIGNGSVDRLQQSGHYEPPRLSSLEEVLDRGLDVCEQRTFVDLWDATSLAACSRCQSLRIERLSRMNLSQQKEPAIECSCEGSNF